MLEDVIIQLRDKLCRALPETELIYWFGSTAMGLEHGDSDLDLALLQTGPMVAWDAWNLAQKLSLEIHRSVDLVDLRQASAVLKMEIVSKGRLLFEKKSNQHAEFEMLVFSDYARLNEERRDILKDIQERGTIYG